MKNSERNKKKEKCIALSALSLGAAIISFTILALIFLAPLTPVVFSEDNDSFEANVTVGNTGPQVGDVFFNDTDVSNVNITLTAGSDTNLIMCNATITDENGYQDITTSGEVNATFYHQSSTMDAADDKNVHYTNTSCSFVNPDGNTVTAVCTALFEHEALNGTWNCTISAKDGAGSTARNSTTEPVDQLLALTVLENSIHFGNMNTGESSSVANYTNITNEGNVKIDLQVQGNADMNCSILGNLGISNISYNTTGGSYATMSDNKLSTSLSSILTAFNLVPEGMVPFAEDEPATNNTYWTINIPTGVRGECNNTITIVGVISENGI